MADRLALPSAAKPPVERDGRIRLPARWIEDGSFGTIRIPHEDYGKWAKKHCVNGNCYAWNGLYFDWCQSPHRLRVPTILPDGEHYFAELPYWYPGDPLPHSYRRAADGVSYAWDKYRDAYVRAGQECKGTPADVLRGMVIGLALTATFFLWFIGVPMLLYNAVVLVQGLGEESPTRENAYDGRSQRRVRRA
jgi:hypothetical protein